MNALDLNLKIIYLIVLTFCCGYSWVSFQKLGPNKIPFFHWFLTAVVLVEYIAVLGKYQFKINVDFIYVVYLFSTLVYFTFLYSSHELLPAKKKIILGIGMASCLLFIPMIIFFTTHTFFLVIGNTLFFFIILLALHWYLKVIIKSEELNIIQEPMFWISTANLLWAVYWLFRLNPMYYLNTNDPNFLLLLQRMVNAINILLYGFYIRAIQCNKYPTN